MWCDGGPIGRLVALLVGFAIFLPSLIRGAGARPFAAVLVLADCALGMLSVFLRDESVAKGVLPCIVNSGVLAVVATLAVLDGSGSGVCVAAVVCIAAAKLFNDVPAAVVVRFVDGSATVVSGPVVWAGTVSAERVSGALVLVGGLGLLLV